MGQITKLSVLRSSQPSQLHLPSDITLYQESWTPVAARSLCSENEFATAIEAAMGLSYRQRDGVPGLEIRQGCARSSVSWVYGLRLRLIM